MIPFRPSAHDAQILFRAYHGKGVTYEEIEALFDSRCAVIATVLRWNSCNTRVHNSLFFEQQEAITKTILHATRTKTRPFMDAVSRVDSTQPFIDPSVN
jgi:hypothetical protein